MSVTGTLPFVCVLTTSFLAPWQQPLAAFFLSGRRRRPRPPRFRPPISSGEVEVDHMRALDRSQRGTSFRSVATRCFSSVGGSACYQHVSSFFTSMAPSAHPWRALSLPAHRLCPHLPPISLLFSPAPQLRRARPPGAALDFRRGALRRAAAQQHPSGGDGCEPFRQWGPPRPSHLRPLPPLLHLRPPQSGTLASIPRRKQHTHIHAHAIVCHVNSLARPPNLRPPCLARLILHSLCSPGPAFV